MAEATESGWKAFWNRGGIGKAVLLVVGYLVAYEGLSLLVGLVFGDFIDTENMFASTESVFFGLVTPVLLGALVLVLFGWSTGWLKELFARQSVAGRGWMWIAVALVLVPIVLRLVATNWSAYSVSVVLTVLLAGLFIGFSEELLTRGFVVNLTRRAGHGERVVLVISATLFGLLHAVNLLSGQSVLMVLVTVVYAFGFGAMMYLSLRVTGRLVWVILLHAATDPTTFLATGGIDAHSQAEGSEALLAFAGLFNIAYIAFALLAIFLVKNHAEKRAVAE